MVPSIEVLHERIIGHLFLLLALPLNDLDLVINLCIRDHFLLDLALRGDIHRDLRAYAPIKSSECVDVDNSGNSRREDSSGYEGI